MTAQPSVSVIVASHNQPNALRLVLSGFAAQDDLGFEMVIADDGSEGHVLHLIDELVGRAPFAATVVTQEHSGYGRSRILNEAVLRSTGEHLIFCDGDCVPFRSFVAAHRSGLRAGRRAFCGGGFVRLNLEQSRSLTPEAVLAGGHEGFLTMGLRRHFLHMHLRHIVHRMLGLPRLLRVKGGNFSVDRRSFVDVNGFDEAYTGYRGEDVDLASRLARPGCEGISLWTRAFVCHLDHGLDPLRCGPEAQARRVPRKLRAFASGQTRASRGLDLHVPGTTPSPSTCPRAS